MPITGKFEADFDQFKSATREANTALKAFEDTSVQASAGIAKMERAAADAAPRVNTLHQSLGQFDSVLNALGVHIGPEVRALGELGEASGKSATQMGLIGTAGLVAAAALGGWKIGRLVADFFDLDRGIGNATARLLGYGDVAGQVAGAKQDVMNLAIKRGADAAISYGDALKYNADWFVKHQAAAKDDAAAVKDAADVEAAAAKKAAAELAKWQDAMVELDSAGEGWQGTLEGMDGAVVEAIKGYLEAGVSQGALATAYNLTATQVKAVASELTAETAEATKSAEAAKQAADAAAHWADIMAELNSAGATWQDTLDEIDGTVIEAIKGYLAAGVGQRTLAEAYGLTATQIKAVASALAAGEIPEKKEVAAVADLTQMVRTLGGEYLKAADAKARLSGGSSFTYDLTTQAGVEQYRKMNTGMEITWSNQQLMDFARQGGTLQQLFAMGVIHMKGFAGGVSDAPGGWGMVGENGPEAMYIPKGSTILPHGQSPGGGGAQVIQLVVDGRVLARVVNDYTMKSLKQRQPLPS